MASKPFPDLAALRVPQNFADLGAVKKQLTTVPVRKPTKLEFIQVSPRPDLRQHVILLVHGDQRDHYVVLPDLYEHLTGNARQVVLVTAINRHGDVFLWPLVIPGADGRVSPWHESALEAAKMAERGWVRVVANMRQGAYDIYTPSGSLAEPNWPSLDMQMLLERGFQGKVIDTYDHPILRELRGEV